MLICLKMAEIDDLFSRLINRINIYTVDFQKIQICEQHYTILILLKWKTKY